MYNKKNVLHRHLKNTGKGHAEYIRTCKLYKDVVLQNSIKIENEAIYSANQKQFFKCINSKIHTHSEMSPLRNENGDLETQDDTKAKILNQFFFSVFTNDNDNKKAFKNRQSAEISSSSFNISPALVFAAIHSIKCKNFLDPEGLTSHFYHQLAAELSTPISIIKQTSMDSHTLPIA